MLKYITSLWPHNDSHWQYIIGFMAGHAALVPVVLGVSQWWVLLPIVIGATVSSYVHGRYNMHCED
jgi:hypothetical protein